MPNENEQPAESVQEFTGPEGAEKLSLTGTKFTPIGPGTFRARVRSIPLHHTRIISFQITPTRGDLRSDVGDMHEDLVFFTFLLEGRAVEIHDGRHQVNTPGSIRFVRVSAPYRYVAEQAVHNVSWWVTLSELQPEVAEALRRVTAMEFRNDATARGATAVIRSIVTSPPTPGSAAAASLERILIAQVEAVVMAAEAWRLDPEQAPRPLFHELRAFIAANLARDDLNVRTVSTELQTTPALLSRALVAQGVSLRRLVADIRLEHLTGLLADPDYTGTVTAAALSAGFGGSTQANRALRAKYDSTMLRYRATQLSTRHTN